MAELKLVIFAVVLLGLFIGGEAQNPGTGNRPRPGSTTLLPDRREPPPAQNEDVVQVIFVKYYRRHLIEKYCKISS